MKCPDCGINLSTLSFEGHDVERCFRCGGFWIDSETANRITSGQLAVWRRISSMNPMWGSNGKELCPSDGTRLVKYIGDQVPPSIPVKRCNRCGKWWFPGDALYDYKPAAEAKSFYLNKWSIIPEVKSIILPAFAVVFLLIGTAFGVRLVHEQQQAKISASVGIVEFAANYSGNGEGLVIFKSQNPVSEIKYQMRGGWLWTKTPIEIKNGYTVTKLKGLVEGGEYIISVGGKEYSFVAK